jgi:hypothetical protein
MSRMPSRLPGLIELGREPAAHGGAGEVPERVLADPPRGGFRRGGEAPRESDGGRVQPEAAMSDSAQSPAHAFLDEVPLVAGGPLDELQAPEQRIVPRALLVEGHGGQQREGRAHDELLFAPRPLRDLAKGVGSAVEEVEADGVADGPVVEAAAPTVHLGGRDPFGLLHERGQETGLVPTGRPESGGEFVASTEPPGQRIVDIGTPNTLGAWIP